MRDLGGLTQTVESVRTVRETAFDALARDVRIAARMLVRSRSFAVAVVTTLALGIGANAAIFSVVDALLIRRLPYPDADRVVRLKGFSEQAFIGWGGPEHFSVSPPELRSPTVFTAIGAAVPGGLSLGMEDAERVSGGRRDARLLRCAGRPPGRRAVLRGARSRAHTRHCRGERQAVAGASGRRPARRGQGGLAQRPAVSSSSASCRPACRTRPRPTCGCRVRHSRNS